MKIKVGIVGTSQLSFPGKKEKIYAEMIEQMKMNAAEMEFDLVYYQEQVIVEADAVKARLFMENNFVDFLLILNVSYSSGFLVPILYRTKGAKIGIWSIPEGCTSGPVMFNSFCSNNMYQGINDKYLRDFGIKSKWFYGYANDERFKKRLSITIKALKGLKSLKNSKVALIGGFAPGFNDLYFDERKIFNKLDGIYINRLHEYDEIIKIAKKFSDNDVKSYLDNLDKQGIKATKNANALRGFSIKVYLAYKEFVATNGYNAIAISCWPKFQDDFSYSVCSVLGMLNDDGIIASCEGDLLSAISMIPLQEMSKTSTTLMDFSAFDESDETVLMWHCGPTSLKFCEENGYSLGENYSGMAHEKDKICGCGVVRDMEFDKLCATSFRFSGDMESYLNLSGDFVGNTKESFCGSRGWLGNLKLNNQKIGALDFTNTILSSGFEHHYPIAIGNLSNEVAEMNAWLGIKPIKKIVYSDFLQEKE